MSSAAWNTAAAAAAAWNTGNPKYSKTVKTFSNSIELEAASGDSVVMINPNNRYSLNVLRENEDEWNLPAHHGYVRQCLLTKEMIVLVTRDKDLGLHLEVYDIDTHSKVFDRKLKSYQSIFTDGSIILLCQYQCDYELINVKDQSTTFTFPSTKFKSNSILSISSPHILCAAPHDVDVISVFNIDVSSNILSKKFEFDLDNMGTIIEGVFIDQNVVLLHDDPDGALGALTVHNSSGDLVRKMEWHDVDVHLKPSWCYDYGKFVITFGSRSQWTETVLLFSVEDLFRDDKVDLVPRIFEFVKKGENNKDEPDNDNKDDDAVTVMDRTSIKRYRTVNDSKSLEVEKLTFW